MISAYARSRVSSSFLFSKVAGSLVARESADSLLTRKSFFRCYELSNLILAYDVAGEAKANTSLFKEIAKAMVSRGDLNRLDPQALSNTVYAYAKVGEACPMLFKKVGSIVVNEQSGFTVQGAVKLLWAFAMYGGKVNVHLFKSFLPIIVSRMGELHCRQLVNIAWAFAVVNVPAPSLFNDKFITALMKKENEFNTERLSQLHQWILWQQLEQNSNVCLPPSVQKRCLEAFASSKTLPSRLQDEVVNEIFNIGLQPKEEALLPNSGYQLSALLHVNNESVGIEVDEGVNGKTSLKRRQVLNIDGVRIISLPYRELANLANNHQEMQDYLCSRLGLWHATIKSIDKIIGDE